MGENYFTTSNCAVSYKELEEAMKRVGTVFNTGGFISPYRYPKVKKIIYNFKNPDKPATIVFFDDESKVVVRCSKEEFNKEAGLAQCFLKKCLDCSRKDIQKLINSADIQR